MGTKIKSSCIYCILNIFTNERYVGGTTNFSDRKGDHLYRLRHSKHDNSKLQLAYDEYGEQALKFFILENVQTFDRNELDAREQFWIDKYKPEYNLNPVAGNYFNEKARSKESQQKRLRTIKGRKQSQETKDRRAKAIKEYWRTHPAKIIPDEMKKHLSEINTGNRNPNFGLRRTDETKNKISQGNSKLEYTFCSPDGQCVVITNLYKSSDKFGIPYWILRQLYRGRKSSYNGWTFISARKLD